ncbi:Fe-S cluster assembly ATPase SufC [Candidatus Woesearchaeota archaeon]|jgi:Fe-S cluster assembly ATP-binding protein|nr:Fe-S cluster assembly ATPase SufC [Candidatus Woesearchaeota archaeon]MBT4387085.1 Fe-S cluster assembly ATPase SufC [Candidatus Woesearchaeota archaeon]MBT4596158.1 Fe-S cluster assembly ATPase SufC [Candidatus Woesearchaeota archaeon]MBT5741619.1 Fe-S cluster assembly ATPase SufC [Candidatus Woesearchaeota archaeon]MBT6505265.1 Fe-S cluster assembly ATPase SufC [Candidatus Woesearchaeota archaeon]
MDLEIKNLCVEVEGKEVLKNINMKFEKGKTYAIMGPNGSGKSSLANTICANPKYKITKGKIILNGKDITKTTPDKRARLGLFLSFQYPEEIPGASLTNFLRMAYNNLHEEKLNPMKFLKLLKEKMAELKMADTFRRRYLNQGFSGGEKKRCEILQLSILEPKFAILDEIDSGLDVDALKIVCDMINKIRNNKKEMTTTLITHYNKILQYIHPDKIYILYNGKIIKEGQKELAIEIENNGFENIIKENDK